MSPPKILPACFQAENRVQDRQLLGGMEQRWWIVRPVLDNVGSIGNGWWGGKGGDMQNGPHDHSRCSMPQETGDLDAFVGLEQARKFGGLIRRAPDWRRKNTG